MANATPTTTRDEAQRPLFAGVDVGGTNIKFGIVDDGGQTISQSKIVTDSDRGPAMVAAAEMSDRFAVAFQ